jgi:hypothetical protein
VGEDRRHVAERRVDQEAGEQQQERIVQVRQDYRVGHRGTNVGRAAAAINRREIIE